MSFFATSSHCCLLGFCDTENNEFAKTRTISFLVLSVMHLFLMDFITSGLQLSGITKDTTVAELLDPPVRVEEEEVLLDTLVPTCTSV